jgi:hypothetical protein
MYGATRPLGCDVVEFQLPSPRTHGRSQGIWAVLGIADRTGSSRLRVGPVNVPEHFKKEKFIFFLFFGNTRPGYFGLNEQT